MRKEIADLKDGQAAIRVEISALGQQVAGLTVAVYSGHNRLADMPDPDGVLRGEFR